MEKKLEFIILFSGHMIDDSNRVTERFPEYKSEKAKASIKIFLKNYVSSATAIASGASGGDILFHEACLELGIHSEMYLAENINEFKKNSVSSAGKDWEHRFDKLTEILTVHILPEKYKNVADSNIWEQTNVWMTDTVLEKKNKKIILLTLWNEVYEGKSGGTEHMIEVMKKNNFTTFNINPLNL